MISAAPTLRDALHRAVDAVLDGYSMTNEIAQQPAVVLPGEGQGKWTYDWPNGSREQFDRGRWYAIRRERGDLDVLVVWCRRVAWGRERERAIVFNRLRPESSVFYPWTEFVETDDARFAATIPDPSRPRASLADGAELPSRFDGATIKRADAVFTTINSGPSLRIVLERNDEEMMVHHGLWVAELRGRV